ncbi:MAG: hypothetical protein M1828_005241 [Chrysothrix sp. TS-e1954]|nr:MAG: hypothetical protein M1828_005241 [Chrysothrix sp. TS-e1954]
MGISHSTARYAAPIAFLYNFAAQQYGMLSTPNMKNIHDAHLSFFSPQPWFIAAFFFSQQFAQAAYLYKLWRSDPDAKVESERRDARLLGDYAPWFALGNLCIGTWMFFWNGEMLRTSDVFCWINTLTQIYYMAARLPPMDTTSTTSILTHVVNKTFAGIGVLDVLHNTSIAFYQDQSPSTLVRTLTGIGFGLGSAASDWIFGGCLVYDLVAMAVGQSGNWRNLLGAYAVGSAGIVAARNIVR